MSILLKDRNGRDDKWHVLKHSIKKSPKNVNTIDFKLTDRNFDNNKQKREIAEALWVKDLRLSLNTQGESIQLKLFN